ncbi:DUF5712 family protein [Hufsiella ginkgonis]|uniref:Molybdopterin-guanine dinucleotide biosynthesis protein MobB n=1 Tax=Hufsiella ginkgonis TaxID=2695274 RepID=A0A7K1XV21_9SPHI|nr:DUF5712 family protein [Hufsiella ginkgonis]MXV14346.1 molybdopterin-guanine dinucleotide biosynthesis protein MobB [Hufsiella ginkgonis]
MFINITDTETANNKGSSGELVHYLDKENRLDLARTTERWFNHSGIDIQSYEVKNRLDNNVAKLGRNESKFFLVNISPSEKELKHLKELYGDEGMEARLKEYAVAVMNEYARNFKRAGIESSKDLLWFGKLERYRYYTHKDPEVKNGTRKRGERKEGEHLHLQVIVSRKDVTNKIKLSPMNNSRGRNTEHSLKVGQFDRSTFKNSGEQVFDGLFRFDRKLKDTFGYANTQKKGNLKERIDLYAEKIVHDRVRKQRAKQNIGMAPKYTNYLEKPKAGYLQPNPATNFLGSMLNNQHDDGFVPNGFYKKGKRKKKRPGMRM